MVNNRLKEARSFGKFLLNFNSVRICGAKKMYLAYLLPSICLEFRQRHEECLEITRVPIIVQTL